MSVLRELYRLFQVWLMRVAFVFGVRYMYAYEACFFRSLQLPLPVLIGPSRFFCGLLPMPIWKVLGLVVPE